MQTATAGLSRILFFNVWREGLNFLKDYWRNHFFRGQNDFSQPLLSKEEIVDLQLRVQSRYAHDNRFMDTAEQRAGDKRSIYRGYGLDYEESRPYQAGDDPRYINWKHTARTGELYMKVFREERRPGIVVFLDRRKTMHFGTRTRLKATQAARVATCIAFSAQRRHAAISAVVLEANQATPTLIKHSNDKQSVDNLIRVACAPCSSMIADNGSHKASKDNECEFGYAINILQETQVPGSTIYLIGDFIDLGEQHRSSLMKLSAHNNVHAIHVSDPSEKELPKAGPLHFHTLEDGQDISIDTMNPSLLEAYKKSAKEHFNARKIIFSSINISYSEVSTDDDSLDAVLSVV